MVPGTVNFFFWVKIELKKRKVLQLKRFLL